MKNYITPLLVSIFLLTVGCKNEKEQKIYGQALVSEITDPLPSWNDVKSKQNIIAFVEGVTNENSLNFIPVSERIATFDNDGNLWSEQPLYFQLYFAIDRVKEMAVDHSEWKHKQPFKAVLENDMKELAKQGEIGRASCRERV